MQVKRTCLSVALSSAFGVVVAQDHDHAHNQHDENHQHELEEVIVTASPLSRQALEMTQAAAVLSGDALADRIAGTLGETVSEIPGVQSATFGPGVGRPIIRGLEGSRVGVLENSVSSNDVSALSADHAVTIEPFLADQIEVLRGPATLLYGSDTIGGVVNVKTNRIPKRPTDGLEGRVELRGDSVADEVSGAVGLDFGSAQFAFHADAFYRDTSDYEIPGFAEVEPDEDEKPGLLENSAVRTSGGALGLSWLGSRGHVGAALSRYETLYGIPGAGHHHEEDHEGDHEGEREGDHEGEGEEEEAPVTIDVVQDKLALEGVLDEPFSGFESLKVLASFNDYAHTEFEGEEVGTLFMVDSTDVRLESVHLPIAGWTGALGVQFGARDFDAIGEEAFVPASETDFAAAFLIEEREFGPVRAELGLRLEDVSVDLDDGRNADFSPFAASAGLVWHFTESGHLAFNVSSAERAPSEEELFAEGPHVATQTFEIGDATLEEEMALNTEVSLRRHSGALTGVLTVFRNDFDDFIYLADTGMEEDELPVRIWSQRDATFTGAELELNYDFGAQDHGHYRARLFADVVDAEFDDGTHVPRTAPARVGFGIDYDLSGWRAGLDVIRYQRQSDLAPGEEPTPGYTMVNADLAYRLVSASGTEWELYLRGRNLGDTEARNHTSLLKESTPLPGRNLILGFRTWF